MVDATLGCAARCIRRIVLVVFMKTTRTRTKIFVGKPCALHWDVVITPRQTLANTMNTMVISILWGATAGTHG